MTHLNPGTEVSVLTDRGWWPAVVASIWPSDSTVHPDYHGAYELDLEMRPNCPFIIRKDQTSAYLR